MASTGSAFADEGWYASVGVGNGGFGDTEVDGYRRGAEINGTGDWRQNAAFGYDWADGWRAEAELAHRFNDFGAIGNHEDSASDLTSGA
ncbi:hypothetical protein [Hyphobacterium sp. CCMP332]|uniref:hypothetical protein n=1 Tax=Hyphobacterium sp. CCMP332 TaxID=2749086 RepID=UPI001F2FA7B0|nr:hypothetical protein [Hyphobacterium sp. CCMP332]